MNRKTSAKRHPIFRRSAGLFLLLCAVLVRSPAAFPDEMEAKPNSQIEYKISTGDTVRIIVFEQPNLSGNFKVGSIGQVSVPGIGRVVVGNLSESQIEQVIIEKLKQFLQISDPKVTVNISEYKPIYIMGFVNSPGQYPYTPGTTVLQALAIAGGYPRLAQDSAAAVRQGTDFAEATGELETLLTRYWASKARFARLTSEQSGATEVDFPCDVHRYSELPDRPDVRLLEHGIFKIRAVAVASMIEQYEKQIAGYKEEISTLRQQLQSESSSIELAEQELRQYNKLKNKGLARSSRIFELRRRVSELKSDRLRVSVLRIQANQKIGDSKLRISELRAERATEIADERAKVEIEIEVLRRKIEPANRTVQILRTGLQIASTPASPAPTITYKISRRGEFVEGLTETSALQAGDVLQILTSVETKSTDLARQGLLPSSRNLAGEPHMLVGDRNCEENKNLSNGS